MSDPRDDEPYRGFNRDREARAASRSEQSAGTDDGCGDPACPHCPAAPAAEAAQSPQEGAAPDWRDLCERMLPVAERAVRDEAPRMGDPEPDIAGLPDSLRRARESLLMVQVRRALARAGRSVSDRPPASESPGPLAALREALQRLLDGHKDWLADGAHGIFGEARRLAAGIDAALRESSAERGGEER